MLSTSVSKHPSLLSETIDRYISNRLVVPDEEGSIASATLQDVKIIPSVMEFERAFEGKKYCQKLTIQNCGKDRAFIRICPASSYAFQIKPLIRGKYLSPGLSLIRYIAYTYMRATAIPLSWVPIYINGVQLQYKIVVSLSQVMISAIPQQIDFGTIDAGHSAAVRMLSLRNDGSKGTRFAIDLGRNEIELIVEPCKGIIQPHDTVTFRVECLGTTEGLFSREFWIKCDTPLRIGVKGKIIIQQLYSIHPNTTQDFSLVDFPKTYFGTQCIRTLVVKNFSAMPAVYCTLAELANVDTDLEEASKRQPQYNNFKITPLEGALVPHEAKIFQFIYKPVRDATKRKHERYQKCSFCSYKIIRIPCMDLSQVVITENATVQDLESLSRNITNEDPLSPTSLLSIEEMSSLKEFRSEIVYPETTLALSNAVRIILYGEAETASIVIRPDSLTLLEIPGNTPATRELLLINQSSSLPIIFNYRKTCSVNVEPSTGILSPSGRLEVCVTITPVKIGRVETKIIFDLLYFNRPKEPDEYVIVGEAEISLTYDVPSVTTCLNPIFNMGITPMYIKEVGICTDDVRFNSPIKMPRATLLDTISNKNSDLIAFPNDRPKSLRPWRNPTKCRTIFAGIPRAITTYREKYQLTTSKSDLKHEEYSYYKNYTRQEGNRLRLLRHVTETKLSVYDVFNGLMKNTLKPKCPTINKKESGRIPFTFIPLTPLQLNKIKVHPSYIKLGKMAPNSTSTRSITIENQNDNPIRIIAKSRKPVISFPNSDHKILKPSNQTVMQVTYNAGYVTGRFNVIIDFIINDNHTFAVSMTADVVPKCVKFNNEDITFQSNEILHKYLDIYNPVNVPIDFQWQIPESCFQIEPLCATVPPDNHITCMISCIPHHANPSGVEATLYSENGRHQTVNVVANFNKPTVILKHTKVVFNNIPLNLPIQGINVLKNAGFELVTFSVLNPEPMPGVSVSPNEGVFHGCAEQIFNINVKISACISFVCTIEIEVQRVKTYKFQILGSVICPVIEIKPDILQLRKIVPNSFERQVFVVINKSNVTATIEFPLTDYSEYTILETHDFDSRAKPVTRIQLEEKEQQELYLHFIPMGAASYSFYLPLVINGLLGPVYKARPETLKTSFYTDEVEKNYIELYKAKSVKMPKNLPILQISTAVGGDMLRFSKLHLRFKHKPHSKDRQETHIDLKIWNASKNTCKFCIRTDELIHPFSLKYLTGNEVQNLPYAIVCVLGPNEDLTLRAEFLPTTPGSYYIKLPIYVRHYLDGNIFNYLSFSGWFPAPTISVVEKDTCLEPVPLKCDTEYTIFLKTDYHPLTCKVSAKSEIPEIRVIFTSEITSNESKPTKELRIKLTCCIKTAKFFDSNIIFYCDCNAQCYVNIKGCSDNCSLTTHSFIDNFTKTLYNQPLFSNTKSLFFSTPIGTDCVLKSCKSFDDNTDTMSTLFSTANVFTFNTNYNESSFPLFPDDYDETDYAKYMRNAIIAVEEWLFHQGFYGGCYYKIPEGIAAPPDIKKSVKNQDDKKKTETFEVLKYVELLTRLAGSQVSKYIPIRKIPEDNANRVNYIYTVYAKAKEFIIIQEGFLPHVAPEYLLTYKDYIEYMKNVYPLRAESHEPNVPDIMDEHKFYRISKQSWMDMILQTYKVFVLARIRYPIHLTEIGSNASKLSADSYVKSYLSSSLSQTSLLIATENYIKEPDSQISQSQEITLIKNSSPKTIDDTNFWQELSQAEPRNCNIFNESEIILLYWLEYNFNKQIEVLWGPEGLNPNENIPEKRNVRFFDVDLCDGLILIVLTTIYCPYLIPNLTDVYLNPTCTEQAFHNASKLIQSWNLLGLSFTVTPKQIINPNGLQMLMLVNYLYEVLPTLYPVNEINFKAGLSLDCTEQINIENLSNCSVTYTVIFFQNDNESFTAPKSVITLRPRQKGKVEVKYTANRICLDKITMILNGETPKRNYAKSMAFALIGEPVPSYSTTTITIPAPLYTLCEVNFRIQSPYAGAHVYQIFYAFDEPSDIRTCKIMPWAVEKHRNVPKRMISDMSEIEFNEDGVGTFDVIVCCVTTNEKAFWIIMKNPQVGDFTFKVVTIPEIASKNYTPITVLLPNDFNTVRCSCKNNIFGGRQCPRTVIISIPSRNDMLWNAVTESMMKVVDEKDLPFWKKYLGTDAGIRLNKWIADDPKNETSYDIQEIFGSTVNYKIILENPSNQISMASITTIEDVHSLDKHEIPIHLNNEFRDFNFTLESERGIELRHYNVHFTCKNKPTVSKDMQLENVQ